MAMKLAYVQLNFRFKCKGNISFAYDFLIFKYQTKLKLRIEYVKKNSLFYILILNVKWKHCKQLKHLRK